MKQKKQLNQHLLRFKETYPQCFKAKHTDWNIKKRTPKEILWDFADRVIRDALKWMATEDKHPEDYSSRDFIFRHLEALPALAIHNALDNWYSDLLTDKVFRDMVCNPLEYIEIADKIEYPWFNLKKHSHGPTARILVGICDGDIKITINSEGS